MSWEHCKYFIRNRYLKGYKCVLLKDTAYVVTPEGKRIDWCPQIRYRIKKTLKSDYSVWDENVILDLLGFRVDPHWEIFITDKGKVCIDFEGLLWEEGSRGFRYPYFLTYYSLCELLHQLRKFTNEDYRYICGRLSSSIESFYTKI